MNLVLLLCSIGVFAHYTGTSGTSQVNQVENTPKLKPPKLLWDPEQRMWVENDDEEFYGKDYSGDVTDVVSTDIPVLEGGSNETDPIEDEEGINEELFYIHSSNDTADIPIASEELRAVPITKTKLSTNPPVTVKKVPDDFVKYEEKISSNIERPLNQKLDQLNSNGKNHNTKADNVNERLEESFPKTVVEVNPATDYPLWALEFESKRTRPLQREFVKASTEPNIIQRNNVGVTELQVIPLDPHDAEQNGDDDQKTARESRIINIKQLPTGHKDLKEQTHVGVYTEKEILIPVRINASNNVKTSIKKIQSTTTIKPNDELLPEVILPEDTNVDGNGDNESASGLTNNHSTYLFEKHNTTTVAPNHIGKTSVTPLKQNGTSQSTDNGTNLNGQPLPCVSSTTVFSGTILHWPETPINVTTISQELCLKDDGSPVTRTCANGLWTDVNTTCTNKETSTKTLALAELLHSKSSNPSTICRNLKEITTDSTNVTSYQVHLMSKLLEVVAKTPDVTQVDNVVQTVSNIMHYEPQLLKQSQDMLNSTDKILFSLDDYLLNTNTGENGYISIITNKLLVQEANLQKTDFSGFKLTGSTDTNGFQPHDISLFNKTLQIITGNSKNLELVLVIPEKLKTNVRECSGSKANPNIITSVFYDDTLFNTKETQHKCEEKVLSVLIPGFNCTFDAPLQIVFKPSNNSENQQMCAYWEYGSNKQSENIKGQWVIEGKPKQFLNTSYQFCEFSHVTHFSLLVLGDLEVGISEADKKALDIITAIGSGLSLLGLLAVFVTAIVFKSYRSANAVVIHFSIAMAAQIVLLYLADHTSQDRLMCTIFGAALHYVVISQFCWMLTIALLQYKRYVLVFSNPTKYLMTKACVFAWGLPLVPVIVIISISPDNYGRNSYSLCYAVGNYFVFGILIPVALIVFINLLVFLRIMIYIASRKIKAHRKMDNATSLQLRLAIMLYFLLGLTWGFGLIAAIGGGIVYSYLFCITATLQGFVLFLFFIALSEKTRSLWGTTLWCPCLDQKKKYDVSTDSSSHPMVRRPTSTNTSDTFTEGTGNDVFQKYKNRSSKDF